MQGSLDVSVLKAGADIIVELTPDPSGGFLCRATKLRDSPPESGCYRGAMLKTRENEKGELVREIFLKLDAAFD